MSKLANKQEVNI